jgi:hypothetical protein
MSFAFLSGLHSNQIKIEAQSWARMCFLALFYTRFASCITHDVFCPSCKCAKAFFSFFDLLTQAIGRN